MLHLIFIVLVLVSLILLIVTVALAVNHTRKMKHYAECTGIIERFWKRKSPLQDAGKSLISPIVSYTVDGKNYTLVGNYCTRDMKVGQEITLLYDTNDPSEATVKRGLYVAPLITGALTVFAIFAVCIFIALKLSGLIVF